MDLNIITHQTLLPRVPIVERNSYIIDRCKGKHVLHLGAADSGYCEDRIDKKEWLHGRLMESSTEVTGIDFDRKAIKWLADNYRIENIICGNLENLKETDLSKSFDVIVAGEILEHLHNCGLFLEGVKAFFNSKTRMILTVPNAFSLWRFLLVFRNKEIVNTDHVNYFSFVTLRCLLLSHGFRIENFLLYDNTERSFSFRNSLKTRLSKIILKFSPFLAAGIICEVSLPSN
jgi:hypothetical protein